MLSSQCPAPSPTGRAVHPFQQPRPIGNDRAEGEACKMPEEVRTESPAGKSPEGASGITEPLGQDKGESKADSLVEQYVAQVPSDDLKWKLMHAAAGTRRIVYVGVTILTAGFAGIIAKVAWALPPEV